jgi:uncharacterized membrane protein
MLKQFFIVGLLLLSIGAAFFTSSLTVETQARPLELETLLYKKRFEMSREEAFVLLLWFPGNVTIIASIGANMCVGLKIYTGEAFKELFKTVEELDVEDYPSTVTIMENISKPISWSHREYYRHVIQNNETSTYYFLVYNYPSCYPKTVNLEIGYIVGRFEEPKEERLTFKNQMLSIGLAAMAIGFLILMYGLAKEPKK